MYIMYMVYTNFKLCVFPSEDAMSVKDDGFILICLILTPQEHHFSPDFHSGCQHLS